MRTVALYASLLMLPLAPAILAGISTMKVLQKGGEQWFQPSTQVAAEKPAIPPVKPSGETNNNDKQKEGTPPQGHPPEQGKRGK